MSGKKKKSEDLGGKATSSGVEEEWANEDFGDNKSLNPIRSGSGAGSSFAGGSSTMARGSVSGPMSGTRSGSGPITGSGSGPFTGPDSAVAARGKDKKKEKKKSKEKKGKKGKSVEEDIFTNKSGESDGPPPGPDDDLPSRDLSEEPSARNSMLRMGSSERRVEKKEGPPTRTKLVKMRDVDVGVNAPPGKDGKDFEEGPYSTRLQVMSDDPEWRVSKAVGEGGGGKESESQASFANSEASKNKKTLPEQLRYLETPTLMGWYFDGYYTPQFRMNEEWTMYFNKKLQDQAYARELEHRENFREQRERYFWPPEKGVFFKTKGIYLDLPEVEQDPPPAFSYAESEVHAEEAEAARTKRKREREYRRHLIRRRELVQEELEYIIFPTIRGWYFDGFFTNRFLLNEKYATYFNEMEVERCKRLELDDEETFPEKARRYFWPPDVIEEFMFRTRGIYLDFYEVRLDPPHPLPDIDLIDDLIARFGRIEQVTELLDEDGEPVQMEEDVYEERARRFIPDHEWGTQPDNYYFDDEEPGFFLKDLNNYQKYYYDRRYYVWRLKKPKMVFAHDYFFHDEKGKFLPKNRWRNWYDYRWEEDRSVWTKKGVSGPSKNGLTEADYYFDERRGRWYRKKEGRPFAWDPNGRRYAVKNSSCRGPDDYYWNDNAAKFKLKEEGGQYFFDIEYLAWRDYKSNFQNRSRRIPGQYYWDESKCSFRRKDAPKEYFELDKFNRLYRKVDVLKGLRNPRNWYWHEKDMKWYPKNLNKSYFFTDVLAWKPRKDYDKPWNDYLADFYVVHPEEKEKDDPVVEKAYRDQVLKGHIVESTRVIQPAGKGPKQQGPKQDKKGSSSSSYSSSTSTKHKSAYGPPGGKSKKGESKSVAVGEGGMLGIEENKDDIKFNQASIEREAEIAAKEFDQHTTIQVSNMGSDGVVTDEDLLSFFINAVDLSHPPLPGSEDPDPNVACVKFESEEAAVATLRTMQHMVVKDRILVLKMGTRAHYQRIERIHVQNLETRRATAAAHEERVAQIKFFAEHENAVGQRRKKKKKKKKKAAYTSPPPDLPDD